MSYMLNSTDYRVYKSKDYNFFFNKKTGLFIRWGETKNQDPDFATFPEILDMEITTICTGPGKQNKPCKFCYKSNTQHGENMSFEDFKNIIDKLKINDKRIGITQVALGADATCTSNPDIWKMVEYCRISDIIPNITVADVSDEVADNLAKYMGAVAVSRYEDKNYCYDSVKKLTDRGMKQINIHILVSENTKNMLIETLNDYKTDPRLTKLNAIVMLSLKQKGRGETYNQINFDDFSKICNNALDDNIPIGFDSCTANKFLECIKNRSNFLELTNVVEPCESTCFSSYINVKGDFYPCSFAEQTDEWETGLSVIKCKDFQKDIWNHEKTIKFRENLINKHNRSCPIYTI